jgi:hypothetical protein
VRGLLKVLSIFTQLPEQGNSDSENGQAGRASTNRAAVSTASEVTKFSLPSHFQVIALSNI